MNIRFILSGFEIPTQLLCTNVRMLQSGRYYCMVSYIQSPKKGYTPSDFLIYVLVGTAKINKNIKTNDRPLKSPIKLQQEMQKNFLNFPKFVRFLGHFLKKQCFWKMGVAGIKWLPRPSKIGSFSWKLNGEVLLKVSSKNVDRFQKYKALKWKITF